MNPIAEAAAKYDQTLAREVDGEFEFLRARIKRLESECFSLASGVCEHRSGNEHGNPFCLKTNQLI